MTTATKPLRAAEVVDYAQTTITEEHNMPGPQGADGDPKMRYFTGNPVVDAIVIRIANL